MSLSIIGFSYLSTIIKRTKEANEEYVKWMAFKNFLQDFGNMQDYPIPALTIWEHYLVYATSFGIAELVTICNKKSGVMGVSGVSSDFRDLSNASKEGNHRAQLALDIFTYSCKKFVGSYAAAMGGVDCIVFTAGIGEHDAYVRKSVASDLHPERHPPPEWRLRRQQGSGRLHS